MTNVVFVCSRNQWRSPTAEKVWCRHSDLNVRSAGTSPRSRRVLSINDLRWADVIFVMEQKHKDRIRASFPRVVAHKTLEVLDIPDEYQYMDSELVALFESLLESFLNRC